MAKTGSPGCKEQVGIKCQKVVRFHPSYPDLERTIMINILKRYTRLIGLYIECAWLHIKLFAYHRRHGTETFGDVHILMAIVANQIIRDFHKEGIVFTAKVK